MGECQQRLEGWVQEGKTHAVLGAQHADERRDELGLDGFEHLRGHDLRSRRSVKWAN
jgi:hypothetical protein